MTRSRPAPRLALAIALLPLGAAAAPPPSPAVQLSPPAVLLQQGKHKEGLQWLDSFGTGTREEQRYRGLFHHGLAQPDAALRHLVPVYRADPRDDVVALAVAEASLWKKDYRTAVNVVGQLQSPDAPEALRVRGMVFEQAGRLPEALAQYERAIAGLALPWGTMERKAQVLSWLKRHDESAAVYRTIIESKAASQGLRHRCRVRLAELTAWRKDFAGALDQLTSLLRDEPKHPEALLLRGQILEWQGDFAEAKRTYARLLEIDSSHAEARLRLGKLLWVK